MGNLLHRKTLLCVARKGAPAAARCAALETAGYTVVAAHNIEEALKIFVSQTVDAVLLDASFGTAKKDSPGVLMSTIRPYVPIILMQGESTHVRRGVFAQVFRKRAGARSLLRILENVIGPAYPKQMVTRTGR